MLAGDHVRVLREGRWDHAIDCGDRTVIHFVGGAGTAIRRSPLADFVRVGERVEVVPHAERVYPPREVVARAYSRMCGPSFVHMFTDAEQFAVWCKSGLLQPPPAGAAPGPRPAPESAAPAKVRAPARRGGKKAGAAKRAPRAKAPKARARARPRKAARPAKKTARSGRKRR